MAAYLGAAARLTVMALLTGVGCTSVIEQIRPRAAFDLNCAQDKVQISEIDSGSYGAVGCGRRKRYETHCSIIGSNCIITSEGDAQ